MLFSGGADPGSADCQEVTKGLSGVEDEGRAPLLIPPWLELGHEHSSGTAQGATSPEEFPSRLQLGDSLLSQSLVVRTLMLVQMSPRLPLVDAWGVLSHISSQWPPGCFPALPPFLLWVCGTFLRLSLPAQGYAEVTVRCLKTVLLRQAIVSWKRKHGGFHTGVSFSVFPFSCLASSLVTQAAESALFYNQQKGLQVQVCARLSLLHCSLPVGDLLCHP